MLGRILALPFALSAMFCCVTFVVFLFGVLDPTCGEELSNEALAKHWIPVVKENILKLLYEKLDARWNCSIDISERKENLSVGFLMKFALLMHLAVDTIFFANII